jgi:hypothetical protein
VAKVYPKTDRRKSLAREVKRYTDDPELRERLRPTEDELRTIDNICSGRYVRNASAIVAAFRHRLEFSLAKPPQEHEVKGGISITWVSQAPEELDDELGSRG